VSATQHGTFQAAGAGEALLARGLEPGIYGPVGPRHRLSLARRRTVPPRRLFEVRTALAREESAVLMFRGAYR
jgi:hypothetical protein